MNLIEYIHDKFFKKIFSEVANVKTFLKFVLPAVLQNRLDFTEIMFDSTSYVSEEYKSSFSDIVVKCRTKTEQLPVDIYFLFEHKSFQDESVLLQLMHYMYLIWQKDSKEKKPMRVIIPLVFYHGEGPRQIPKQFIEQFLIADEWKPFLLNFSYILFDTNAWDWQAESSRPLKENIYLLSAMLLMKAAFRKDLDIIRQVFQLWHQMGFIHEKERITFLLIYVTATQDIPAPQLEKLLEESNLKGEEVMPTLAQRWIDEGMEKGMEKGIEKGYLLDRQEVLIMLLSTRFHLNEDEKQFIREVNDIEKLTAALKMVATAKTKEEVLESLQTVVH
ncbi:Rpn family recombination-promoting nuclease/putative transposase [candidate division KSB1 bacterium]|nr:Rpn family recombination-promoting nuclease/putative transposase [candidate division KSB1 bacterium]